MLSSEGVGSNPRRALPGCRGEAILLDSGRREPSPEEGDAQEVWGPSGIFFFFYHIHKSVIMFISFGCVLLWGYSVDGGDEGPPAYNPNLGPRSLISPPPYLVTHPTQYKLQSVNAWKFCLSIWLCISSICLIESESI